MEVTIEKLKKINGQDPKPKTKNTLSPSDLELHSLSIAAPKVTAVADVEEDVNDDFSEYDGYFSEEEEEGYVTVAAPTPDEKEKPIAALNPEEESGVTVDMVEKDQRTKAYTIRVDGHRILTVSTFSNTVAARWMREVLGFFRKKRTTEMVVGVCVDREYLLFERGGVRDSPYDIIQLCIGSQCLIYELPLPGEVHSGPISLARFFADRRIIAAGVNMSAVAEKLLKDHGMRFSNVLDLNKEAEEVLEMDLKRYDLDRLGMAVLGPRRYIDRPEVAPYWFPCYHWRGLGMEKVKYSTYDAYLSYMVGAKLLEMKRDKMSPASAGKKSNKKKGNNN